MDIPKINSVHISNDTEMKNFLTANYYNVPAMKTVYIAQIN